MTVELLPEEAKQGEPRWHSKTGRAMWHNRRLDFYLQAKEERLEDGEAPPDPKVYRSTAEDLERPDAKNAEFGWFEASPVNCISSLCKDGKHRPALDIDMSATLTESTTPGHHHLMIDCPMSWKKYKRLMKELARAGVIEEGYYRASVAKRQSLLAWRRPCHRD